MKYDIHHIYHVCRSENPYFWMLLPFVVKYVCYLK